MYLVRKIIDKCENKSARDWLDGACGNRTMKIQQADYDACGKAELLREICALEENGLLRVTKWVVYGDDAAEVRYRLEDLPCFYGRMKDDAKSRGEVFVPRQEQVHFCQNLLESELAAGVRTKWIRRYYEALLEKLVHLCDRSGSKIPADFHKMDVYLPIFRGLDELEEPMFKRVFSKKYLGNSKIFEQEVQNHVISTARMYYNEVIEPDMDDTAVLEQLLIREYAQEMALKGPLHLTICGNEQLCRKAYPLNLSVFVYGTVLNSETLKYAQIDACQPKIRRVVTIENKANFVAVPYREDTLYIFSHGYFSPRESEFLRRLRKVLETQTVMGGTATGETAGEQTAFPISYFHSGDLDYGGVKIFEYIQKHIFPKLQPLQMDVETYNRYEQYAEPLKESARKKLEKTEVPILQELIQKLCETGKGIEQESFLV